MTLTRRGFIKLSATPPTTAFSGIGLAAKPAKGKPAAGTPKVDRIAQLKPEWSKQTTTICCYCAVGCGLIVTPPLRAPSAPSTSKATRTIPSTRVRCAPRAAASTS